MKLQHKVATLLASLALAALPTLQVAAKGSYYYTFNESLKPWSSAAEGSSHSLQLMLDEGPKGGKPTNSFANLSTNGVSLDLNESKMDVPLPVGAWATAKFPVGSNDSVHLRLDARSTSNCEGCELKVYIGRTEPAHITQFSSVEGSNLKGYWQTFNCKVNVIPGESPDSGRQFVYVAIGLSSYDATIGLDNIEVAIFPAP